jgi:hypothetical protein
MITDFVTWIENNIAEARSRKAEMGRDDVYAPPTITMDPKAGDWVIYNPSKFFGANAKRGLESTMYRIIQKRPNGQVTLMHWAPSADKKNAKTIEADVADISHDASFKFQHHDINGATLGEKIWVRIPPGNQKLQDRWLGMFNAYQQGDIERMKQLDKEDTASDATSIGIRAGIEDDPDKAKEVARKDILRQADRKLAANFKAQQGGLIKPQIDDDDDDFYRRKVLARTEEPKADVFADKLAALQKATPAQPQNWDRLVASKPSADDELDRKWQDALKNTRLKVDPLSMSRSPFAAAAAVMPSSKAESFLSDWN